MGEVEKFDGKNLRLNKYDYRKGIQALEEIQKHEKIIYIYQTINNLNLTSSEEEGNNINVHNSNAEDKSILGQIGVYQKRNNFISGLLMKKVKYFKYYIKYLRRKFNSEITVLKKDIKKLQSNMKYLNSKNKINIYKTIDDEEEEPSEKEITEYRKVDGFAGHSPIFYTREQPTLNSYSIITNRTQNKINNVCIDY